MKVQATIPKKPTRTRRPSYLTECRCKLRTALAEAPPKGLSQGPILDNAATTLVIARKDWKHAYNIKKLKVPVQLDGIFGTQAVEQTGSLKVGDKDFYDGLMVGTAKESVVPMQDVLLRGKVYYTRTVKALYCLTRKLTKLRSCCQMGWCTDSH